MKTWKSLVLAAAFLSPALALEAQQVPLKENEVVRNGFYAIGLADEIRKNCPDISPRLIRAYSMLKSLESYARENGYSEADVKALEDDDAAKDALRAEIRSDLAARGVTDGSSAGYCQVGREEIARNTPAGRLLRGN
ncbi:DUF5333 domain-containing protein [Palleronia sp. LCG004]|uniref:DUF5333 domain-containing protein n=1 Tax=Palleronia sp. LCG004 TaxID=3079304 RepID=UPI002943C83E|nr:DUF5333 domain-containing protein [Palleronia sp. LCG004]WOI54894.1 DUF5333 domain-containing protein [Palleronia sp. LCG004]